MASSLNQMYDCILIENNFYKDLAQIKSFMPSIKRMRTLVWNNKNECYENTRSLLFLYPSSTIFKKQKNHKKKLKKSEQNLQSLFRSKFGKTCVILTPFSSPRILKALLRSSMVVKIVGMVDVVEIV